MRRHGRIRRVLLITLAAILVALISTCLYVNYFGPVDQASMSYSVAREEGDRTSTGFYADCEPQRTGVDGRTHIWSCDLMTTEESDSGGSFRVIAHGRCWTARRMHNGTLLGLPRRMAGCVGLFSQLRIGDSDLLPSLPRSDGYY